MDSWSTDRVSIWKSIQPLCLLLTVNTLNKQNTKITRMGRCGPDMFLFSKRVRCDFTSTYGTGFDGHLLYIQIHCCKANHNRLLTKCMQPETIIIILFFFTVYTLFIKFNDVEKVSNKSCTLQDDLCLYYSVYLITLTITVIVLVIVHWILDQTIH